MAAGGEGAGTGAGAGAGGLSEYEQQRAAHVARNREYMARLGVAAAAPGLAPGAAARGGRRAAAPRVKPPRVKVEAGAGCARRQSARLQGRAAEPAGDLPDDSGSDEELPGQKRARPWPLTPKREKPSVEETLLESQRWLEASRAALLARMGSMAGAGGGEEVTFRDEAVKRWGEKVLSSGAQDWKRYVLSRMSTPPPASALDLMQEYYAHCPWRLLVSCVLMSRVSSHATKSRCVAAFFERYPTPSEALDAEAGDLQAILGPLGLFPNRLKSLVAVSERFLEMPAFDVGLQGDLKIYGIGQFGLDSFQIFIRGRLDFQPGDRTLQAFVRWQKAHGEAGPEPGGAQP